MKRGFDGLILLAGVALLAFLLVPNQVLHPRSHEGSALWGCKSNLKNIATALEMYAADNHGSYPANLDELTRTSLYGPYLKVIPTCPSVGKMTYLNYQVSIKPHSFSFACCGNNHGPAYASFKADSTNYPQYNAEQGLLDHP